MFCSRSQTSEPTNTAVRLCVRVCLSVCVCDFGGVFQDFYFDIIVSLIYFLACPPAPLDRKWNGCCDSQTLIDSDNQLHSLQTDCRGTDAWTSGGNQQPDIIGQSVVYCAPPSSLSSPLSHLWVGIILTNSLFFYQTNQTRWSPGQGLFSLADESIFCLVATVWRSTAQRCYLRGQRSSGSLFCTFTHFSCHFFVCICCHKHIFCSLIFSVLK